MLTFGFKKNSQELCFARTPFSKIDCVIEHINSNNSIIQIAKCTPYQKNVYNQGDTQRRVISTPRKSVQCAPLILGAFVSQIKFK